MPLYYTVNCNSVAAMSTAMCNERVVAATTVEPVSRVVVVRPSSTTELVGDASLAVVDSAARVVPLNVSDDGGGVNTGWGVGNGVGAGVGGNVKLDATAQNAGEFLML